MFKRRTDIRKVSKKFTNFEKEEKWLGEMLAEGWILKEYGSEDVEECQYIFRLASEEEKQNGVYKINYRLFMKKRDLEDYQNLFEEAEWQPLAKDTSYMKHIFYTNSSEADRDIFSDKESYQGREKRRMKASLLYSGLCILGMAVLFTLWRTFEASSFGGAGMFVLFAAIKNIADYFKHRKVYKSLI